MTLKLKISFFFTQFLIHVPTDGRGSCLKTASGTPSLLIETIFIRIYKIINKPLFI